MTMMSNFLDFENCESLFIDPTSSGIVDVHGEAVRWPQIMVNNLPKHAHKGDVQRYFNNMGIEMRKLKIVPQKPFCFVTFNTDEAMNKAIAYIKSYLYKDCKVSNIFSSS